MKASAGWFGLMVLMLAGAPAAADEALSDQRELFRRGWEAAARADRETAGEMLERLSGYLLAPYLEFELLRQDIDNADPARVGRFLQRHRDWSFAPGLKTAWLRSLGRRGHFDLLERHGATSLDTRVRCHRLRGAIRAGRDEELAARVAGLWLVGHSQPEACDEVFAWWRRQGHPDAETAWQRFELAVSGGETALAGYLVRYLDPAHRTFAERWLSLARRPWYTLRQARHWPDHEWNRRMLGWALARAARRDWQQADELWGLIAPHFEFGAERRRRIEREIALFRAVALDAGAPASIDALPAEARDRQMLEWRARAAMAHGDWEQVLASIRRMDVRDQARDRWRYWRGRALAELERPEAMVALATLSGEASYYGFLAAARLGQHFHLCSRELTADAVTQRRLVADPELERALELHHVGLHDHARRTWRRVARRLDRAGLRQAALLVAGRGWHDRAIAALNQTGARQAYPWRFPMMEKGRVMAAAERWSVDPALIYGLMRAESGMQIDAHSSAGARGLLQLMAGTADDIARRNELDYNGHRELSDPGVNIALGVAHLAELEERFDDNWLLVAAAYNAGIHVVEDWLADGDRSLQPADVWLETLPYYETRDYVPRVLAFATIYEWQLERPATVMARHLLGDAGRAEYRFACPAGGAAPVAVE